MRPKQVFLAALALCVLTALCGEARGEVFHSRESALRLAFPDADSVQKHELFLSRDEAAAVEREARVRLQSRLVTVYVGTKDGGVTGYAFIETHKVRSLPETIMVVVDPQGRVGGVHMLAFHEPPEYAPAPQWLAQFAGHPLDEELRVRGDIDGITGATLTANALTASVRRLLAVFVTVVSGRLEGGSAASTSASASTDQ